jgi:hypothetical protein
MRTTLVFFGLVLATACTKHNPAACCTTDEQCQQFGLDGVIGCTLGEVCSSTGACVAPQCTTSADCTDPTAPVCINQTCVASCTGNSDCTGASSGPYCGSDGACVACVADSQCTMASAPVCDATTNVCRGCQSSTDCGGQICDTTTGACVVCDMDSQCPASAPICDTTTNSCRACGSDSECSSDVCLVASGTCADPADIWYVAGGGTDTGPCSRTTPCFTIAYAISKASGATQIIKILGGTYDVGSGTALSTFSGTIDGDGTSVTADGTSTSFVFTIESGNVTISNLTFNGATDSIDVTGGVVGIYDVTFNTGAEFEGGTTTASHITVQSGFATTNSAGLTLEHSLVRSSISGRDGVLHIDSTLFDEASLSLISASGTVTNSVFVSANGGQVMSLVQASSATVSFDTFVNMGSTATTAAFTCTANVTVDENIFVWASAAPISNCSPTYSLFDTTATLPAGTGNIQGDPSKFFANLPGQDFHLATGSPAIGAGNPSSTVTTDFDGNPRPNPAGSHPDIGAFESPQ